VKGRLLNEIDILQNRKVCIIGERVEEVLFEKGKDPIGEYIKINGVYFQVVGVFGGTLFFLYTKSKKQPDVFETKNPFVSDVVMKTVATGSVVPRFEIEIKPQVSGIIDELFVVPGERVKKDQVIARIKIIPDMVTLNSAETRLNRAKISFEDAKTDYEHQQKLFDQDVISYEELRNAKVAYDSAREELTAAENNLELIKNGVTKKAAESTNTLVRSTINGMVLDVPVEEGNSVIQSNTFNDGTTIATVADMSDMIFEGKVDETEVGKISEGMPIEPEGLLKFENDSSFVEVQAGEEQQFEKRVVQTGLSDGINIEIKSGLTKDDKVKGEKIDPGQLKEGQTSQG
jgi:HlyD family secretion protein